MAPIYCCHFLSPKSCFISVLGWKEFYPWYTVFEPEAATPRNVEMVYKKCLETFPMASPEILSLCLITFSMICKFKLLSVMKYKLVCLCVCVYTCYNTVSDIWFIFVVKTGKESKSTFLAEALSSTASRTEQLKKTILDLRRKRDKHSAVISEQLLGI